jgi:hypothetical protein
MAQLPSFITKTAVATPTQHGWCFLEYKHNDKPFRFEIDLDKYSGRERLIRICRWAVSQNVEIVINRT